MKVNAINTFNYSNRINNNKQYATRPVFKQNQTAGVVPTAIMDTFREAANDKKNKNLLSGKLSYLKEILFSDENTKKAQELKDIIEIYKY